MSITWGAWSSNNRLQCGIELTMSPTTVSASTSSVTITAKTYMRTRYASNESGSNTTPWNVSGAWTGSGYGNGWSLGAMGTKLIGTSSSTQTTSYSGSITVTEHATFSSTYAYPGVSATTVQSISVPARPIVAPGVPTNCGWARVSDTQQTVTWTRPTSTAAAPVQGILVERATDEGSFAQIASLGYVSSYSDTGTSSDHRYQYRVRAYNTAGYSSYTASTQFATTPAAPSNVQANKTASGDIDVTWTDNSTYNTGFTIQHSTNGGSTWAVLATVGDDASYLDNAPSTATTHTYRIAASTSVPVLLSAYSAASKTVQLLSAPNAPTSLAPNGGVVDGNTSITFTWQHNPNDSTPQRGFNLQTRVHGTSTWNSTSGTVTSSASSYTMAGGTYANGQSIDWQVLTFGTYTTGSPYSATATVQLSTAPTVVVNTPAGGGLVNSSTLVVTWGYADADGDGQATWKVTLYDGSGNTLETKSAAGADSSVTMSTHLADKVAYSVGVTVQSTSGLWSIPDVNAFTIAYSKPSTPQLSLTYDPATGSVAISLQTDAASTRTNLCTNGSFETNGAGWGLAGSLTSAIVSDADTAYGTQALEVTATSNTSDSVAYFVIPAFPAGDPMNLAMSVKPVSNHLMHLQIQWRNSSNVNFATASSPDVMCNPGIWTRLDFNAIAPAGTTNCVIGVVMSSLLTSGDSYRLDGALAEDSDQQLSYIDGTVTETATDHSLVARSFDDGVTWAVVADNLDPNSTVIDPIPALGTVNIYRATSISNLPTMTDSVYTPGVLTAPTHAAFVNAGQGFHQVAAFTMDVGVQVSPGSSKALHQFAGRTLPVETSGEQTTLDFTLTAVLYSPAIGSSVANGTSDWRTVMDVSRKASPACLRTPTGLRYFVSTGTPSMELTETKTVGSVTWSMTEIAYTEPTP